MEFKTIKMREIRIRNLVVCTNKAAREFYRATFKASRRTALEKLKWIKEGLGEMYNPYAFFRMERKPIGVEIHALFGPDMEVSLKREAGKSPYNWELVAWPYGDAPKTYVRDINSMGFHVEGLIGTVLHFR